MRHEHHFFLLCYFLFCTENGLTLPGPGGGGRIPPPLLVFYMPFKNYLGYSDETSWLCTRIYLGTFWCKNFFAMTSSWRHMTSEVKVTFSKNRDFAFFCDLWRHWTRESKFWWWNHIFLSMVSTFYDFLIKILTKKNFFLKKNFFSNFFPSVKNRIFGQMSSKNVFFGQIIHFSA